MTLENRLRNIKLWLGDIYPIALSILLSGIVILYAYGCESKTKSLLEPNLQVTRSELQIELDTLLAKARAGETDLDRQDEIKNMIFNQALVIAQGNQVNPLGVLTTLLSILGVGAIGDDIRLRRQRKRTPVLDKTDQQ